MIFSISKIFGPIIWFWEHLYPLAVNIFFSKKKTMSHAIKATFQDMTESEFRTYGDDLLDSYATGSERKHAAAYLQSINSADSVAIDTERTSLRAKQIEHRRKQKQIEHMLSSHKFDFNKTPALFQIQAAPTNTELTALLATDNSEVYIKGRAHVGDITITGNDIRLGLSLSRGRPWLQFGLLYGGTGAATDEPNGGLGFETSLGLAFSLGKLRFSPGLAYRRHDADTAIRKDHAVSLSLDLGVRLRLGILSSPELKD